MGRGEWLAVIGIVLTLLIGIPSLTALLAEQPSAVTSFLAVLALLLLLIIAAAIWLRRSSPWTILRHEAVLTIKDRHGEQAVLEKRLVMRSNRSKQSNYRHRSLSLDGELGEVDTAGAQIIDSGKHAGDHYVEVLLPRPVGMWEKAETSLSATLANCFASNPESVTLTVDVPIREASLHVIFPADRPPATCQAFYEDAGRVREITEGLVHGHLAIYWDCPTGLFGLRRGEYRIQWRW